MHDDCFGVLGILEDLVRLLKVLLLRDLRVNHEYLVVIHFEELCRDYLKLLLVNKFREMARRLLIRLSFIHDVVIRIEDLLF